MCPVPSFSHEDYCLRRYAVFFCKRDAAAVRPWCRANCLHIFARQLRPAMIFAMVLPPLRDFIRSVFLRRAKEEMLGIDAGAIIALVANTEANGNWPNKQLIGSAVRSRVAIVFPNQAHLAVAINRRCTPLTAAACDLFGLTENGALVAAKQLVSANRE